MKSKNSLRIQKKKEEIASSGTKMIYYGNLSSEVVLV